MGLEAVDVHRDRGTAHVTKIRKPRFTEVKAPARVRESRARRQARKLVPPREHIGLGRNLWGPITRHEHRERAGDVVAVVRVDHVGRQVRRGSKRKEPIEWQSR